MKDIIVMVAAIVGMVLGIYNFVHSLITEHVRLRIIPKSSSYIGRDDNGREHYINNKDHYNFDDPRRQPETLSVEIINLSKFPVTVDGVGLARRWHRQRMVLAVPILPDRGTWPRKLESRDAVTIHFDAIQLLNVDNIGAVKTAFATTQCGTTRYGTSGALKEFIKIAAESN